MIPFALESYGALHQEAKALLAKLADESQEVSAEAFLAHAQACMSVALQCGNADIAARGTQQLRVRQHSGDELPHHQHGAASLPSRAQQSRHVRSVQRTCALTRLAEITREAAGFAAGRNPAAAATTRLLHAARAHGARAHSAV